MKRKANLTHSNPDDAALLWWYGLSETLRTDLELRCLEVELPLDVFVYMGSGLYENDLNHLSESSEKATESINAFADACIDAGLWGFEDDEPHLG